MALLQGERRTAMASLQHLTGLTGLTSELLGDTPWKIASAMTTATDVTPECLAVLGDKEHWVPIWKAIAASVNGAPHGLLTEVYN